MQSDIACCDTGPIFHLHEIGRTGCFCIFSKIYVPDPVLGEISDKSITDCIQRKKIFEVVRFREADKVSVEYTALKFAVSIADAGVLHCARAKGSRVILTDDLELREIARNRGLQPVGSIGILMRSCREKVLTKPETLASLDDLMVKSSLFITPGLVNKAKDAVRELKG
jgi:predicted nucleic acid-binding protein